MHEASSGTVTSSGLGHPPAIPQASAFTPRRVAISRGITTAVGDCILVIFTIELLFFCICYANYGKMINFAPLKYYNVIFLTEYL